MNNDIMILWFWGYKNDWNFKLLWFDEYAAIVFLPYIYRQLEIVKRIGVDWDIYISDSLKGTAAEFK